VFTRSLMPYELLTRYRVLPIGQTLEVLLPHFAVKFVVSDPALGASEWLQ
jgi:hypothetical protein